jgi:hypothetical protein
MGLRGIGAHSLSARTPKLTHSQWMVLLYGYDERWADAFESQAHYEKTWALHREELLADRTPGRKPLAWWHIEARLPYPGLDKERQYLYERKLLSKAERAALLADWRHAFERGWRWSDVPDSLWAEWEGSPEIRRTSNRAADYATEEAAAPPMPATIK